MKIFYSIVFLTIFPFVIISQDLELELIASGFSSPLELKHAGDDRLFVAERGGQIKILNPNGSVNPTPFLNISSIITSGGERGLLGLAFHPDYANNGHFYVYYINLSGNTQISRFTVSSDPDVADPASELQMLSFNQPFTNHNGGHLAFGPDGMLYIASGDGGSGGDPQNNSQNLTNLLGKLLRLDVDAAAPYIPADNPFISNSAALDEIWAYGLRNPWKFSFDPDTDDLWIADVGQNAWEEINREASTAAGLNYGWRCYEGNAPYNTTGCPPQNELTFPLAVYANTGFSGRCSVTGGYVYRGTEYPAIQGLYFFADLCSDEIGTVNPNGTLTFHGALGAFDITSFGVDVDENLYVVAFGGGGSVYKLKDNTPLSIESNEMETILLFPNPARDLVTIEFGNVNVSRVSIINLNGNLINTFENQNNKTLQIDVSDYSSGVYFINLSAENGHSIFKKLIVK
jgi:glucose/arabinose dehydrogenase